MLRSYRITVVLFIILIIVGGSVGYRYLSPNKKEKNIVSNFEDKALISIGKVHHTATRNGITEWRLDAASMNFFAEKKQSLFQDLSVTFYLKDRTEVYLTADQGVLKTGSNDMSVRGNVVVDNGFYQLKTENLHYYHDKHIITSKAPVKITGDSLFLAADAMFLDLNTTATVFQGHVKGILSDNFGL
ncbi:MAG: LPS export ABC transporter periplasmic protein LptC [Desulfobacterales bacterium]|nr:MAG: LPS export ABC transporter periplasmic protein LptC [Desulfobacterales bacterium]UCD89739.1 MAG: LPS export ABC transporter periplasmic protein LptC [Desulfobacterales bacterium]